MQVNAVHILVVVAVAVVMAMAMIMAVRMPVVMSMVMSVVMVTECHHSNQINKKTQSAHNKELA